MPFDAAWVIAWARLAADAVRERREELTALDAAIGDGDHGENLDRGLHAAVAALDEAKKQATRSENEVAQVVRRAEVLRERLHSGTSAARDLSAIQGEIDQLGQRQSALEEAQIVAMEALDSAREESERLSREEAEIRAAIPKLTDLTMDELFDNVYAENTVALEAQRREYAEWAAGEQA